MGTQRRYAWWVAAGGAAVLAACSASETNLPQSVTGAVENAFSRNDAAAFVALFTDDAEIVPGSGPVVKGLPEIGEFFNNQSADELTFDTDTTAQLVREDLAIEQGTYRVRNIKVGKEVETGNYLHVWRKVNGNWKLYRATFNTETAPKGAMAVDEALANENTAPQ
jgi:uncharacterized protein (TIGR02246 family)